MLLKYYDTVYYLTNGKETSELINTLYNGKKVIPIVKRHLQSFRLDNIKLDVLSVHSIGGVKEFEARVSTNIADIVNFYYCKSNRIGTKLEINLIGNDKEDNGEHVYPRNGFPARLRYEMFNVDRIYDKEDILYKSAILDNPNIFNEKYNVICEYGNNLIDRKYINNNYFNVNLHNMSSLILDRLKIIERATEIHLIENSIALLVYLLQLNRGFCKDKTVYFHLYARKDDTRTCTKEVMSKTSQMFLFPKPDNWIFIID